MPSSSFHIPFFDNICCMEHVRIASIFFSQTQIKVNLFLVETHFIFSFIFEPKTFKLNYSFPKTPCDSFFISRTNNKNLIISRRRFKLFLIFQISFSSKLIKLFFQHWFFHFLRMPQLYLAIHQK